MGDGRAEGSSTIGDRGQAAISLMPDVDGVHIRIFESLQLEGSYVGDLLYGYVYPLKGNQDPVPRLHYCFLTAPPLSLHPLPSLISNCLNLPFGTQERSWRLESVPYKQEMGNTERLPCPGAPQRPARFQV